MFSRHFIADANGKISKAGDPGVGFRIVPSVSRSEPVTRAPGNFPVTVRLRGRKGLLPDVLEIANSDVRYCRDEGEHFESIEIEGAEAGDSWLIETFPTKQQGVIPAPTKTRRTYRVQAATTVPTAAPTLSTEGFRVRGGTIGHNFAFAGTLQEATVWVRSAGGTWTNSLAVIDATAEAVAFRTAFASADRVYLQAAAATMTVEVDAVAEVG